MGGKTYYHQYNSASANLYLTYDWVIIIGSVKLFTFFKSGYGSDESKSEVGRRLAVSG